MNLKPIIYNYYILLLFLQVSRHDNDKNSRLSGKLTVNMTKKNKVNKLGVVLLEDWLDKSPPFTKIKNIKSWHKRYFALLKINRNQHTVPKNWSRKGPKSLENLHDVYLVYWESRSDRKKGIKPIRTIPLFKEYTVSESKPPFFEEKFHHSFILNTIERKYYLNAENEERKTAWIETLSQCIESVQGSASYELLNKEPVYESILELLGKTNVLDLPSPISAREFQFSEVSQEIEQHVYQRMEEPEFNRRHVRCGRTRSLNSENISSLDTVRSHRAGTVGSSLRRKTSVGELPTNVSFFIPDEPIYYELETSDLQISNDSSSSASSSTECIPVKKISFRDLTLAVPSKSSLTYTNQSLRIQTSIFEYSIQVKTNSECGSTMQWV